MSYFQRDLSYGGNPLLVYVWFDLDAGSFSIGNSRYLCKDILYHLGEQYNALGFKDGYLKMEGIKLV